jgi:hypothetical protein
MPCDSRLKPKQTIQQRAEEVRRVVARLSDALAAGRVKVRVGAQGAVAFEGWDAVERDGVSDACAFRRLMVSGSALAKAAITCAEQTAGRPVDRRVVARGAHSHDGGVTWHNPKS